MQEICPLGNIPIPGAEWLTFHFPSSGQRSVKVRTKLVAEWAMTCPICFGVLWAVFEDTVGKAGLGVSWLVPDSSILPVGMQREAEEDELWVKWMFSQILFS